MERLSPKSIPIGEKETRELGMNDDVEIGRRAAEDAREKLLPLFKRGENVYILTGLQGGTSRGLVPVLCECVKAADAHTVLYAVIDGEMPGASRRGGRLWGNFGYGILQEYVGSLSDLLLQCVIVFVK